MTLLNNMAERDARSEVDSIIAKVEEAKQILPQAFIGTIFNLKERPEISLYIESDSSIVIDWGNGAYQYIDIAPEVIRGTEQYREQYDEQYNEPNYEAGKSYIITVWGKITLLDCHNCNLISLDVSKCVDLIYLDCSNNQLTSLNIDCNIVLTYLDCSCNQITILDVYENRALNELYCGSNQLTTLNVDRCNVLIDLNCADNKLITLDVSRIRSLGSLSCNDNQLTMLKLDRDLNGLLYFLDCRNNQFTVKEMNKIYEALPNVGYNENGKTQGIIKCDKLCDWSIAEKKGWKVSFSVY